jgi:hypothetical protein
VLIGSLLYLVGTILVTMFFNVPRNNALAAVDPTSSNGARLWIDYVVNWTAWNHVRTIAALAAAALLTIALCRQLMLARHRAKERPCLQRIHGIKKGMYYRRESDVGL